MWSSFIILCSNCNTFGIEPFFIGNKWLYLPKGETDFFISLKKAKMHFQKEVVQSFGRLPSSNKKVVIQRPREMVVKMDDHSVLKNGLKWQDQDKDYYQDIHNRCTTSVLALLCIFSVLDSKLALMYQPTAAAGEFPVTVRPSEIAIVAIVLCVWATAVYVFINQWGKSSAKIHSVWKLNQASFFFCWFSNIVMTHAHLWLMLAC